MFPLLGGVFLGWSLGANNASNVFGSAVASRMLKFWTAAILASVFVLLGALLQGQAVIGAVLGVGIVKGVSTVNGRTLKNILIGWLMTPAVAGFIATALDFAIHLQYVPNP